VNLFPRAEHFITADGSSTLILPGLNEQYHSIHGAIQESNIVYIQNGFNYSEVADINILEIGFGTGLNCLLTYTSFINSKSCKSVNYTAIEPLPIPFDLLEKLNYKNEINAFKINDVFRQIHASISHEKIQITDHFSFTLINSTVQEYNEFEPQYDIIYFDAFGPDTQPEMWTFAIFEKMYSLLKPNGILVTYCAKGAVKRLLKSVGFIVENLPGPPGKREITRGLKQI
jgi:tRNA U34 5-methylaminomethyl-2-thiouridine-forming methyltransferase MnmC